MGSLTKYLQTKFSETCPEGWDCQCEVPVLPKEIADVLGYSPRADVLLCRSDGSRRLWIEFEVSRADPVANHAKFATSHLFYPFDTASVFVSMVSTHVDRGRRNLAAATVHVMRRLGIQSFQTVLLPDRPPQEVKRLNQLCLKDLYAEDPPVSQEIDRAIIVSSAVFETGDVHVHLAGELLEVMLSARRWNMDLATDAGRQAWGKRLVKYLVYDPKSRQFAPSKFCAYLPFVKELSASAAPAEILASREMTVLLYAKIDAEAKGFDGQVAWKHLTRHLGMQMHRAADRPDLGERLEKWVEPLTGHIQLNPEPMILVPPAWFR